MQEEGNNEKQAIGREELMKGEEVKEDEIKGMEEDKVLLQVNGKLFSTTRSKILRQSGTFFEAMLGSGLWEPNESGIYVIERDDTYFHLILDYLENGDASIFKELTREKREILNAELDYYQVKLLTWDAKRCTCDIATFSKDRMTVKIKQQELNYYAFVIGTIKCKSFSVKIIDRDDLRIGFILDENKYHSKYQLSSAELKNKYPLYDNLPILAITYWGDRIGSNCYYSNTWKRREVFKNKDTITMAIEGSNIHIYKNGEDLGAAFSKLQGEFYFPIVYNFSSSPSCILV